MEPRCRNTLWRLSLGLTIALCAAGCSQEAKVEEAEPNEAVPVITAETAVVAARTVTRSLVVRGSLTAVPNEDVRLSALVAGRVDAVLAAEGDVVAAGQVVARIDTRTLKDQQRQAEAARRQAGVQVENARLNLARNEQLFARGVAAGKEVEDARVALAEAQAALEQADAALNTLATLVERADVRSPIAGQVVRRMVSVGEQVDGTAASPILQIANLDWVELAAAVPVDQLAELSVGQLVTTTTDAYAGREFPGAVVAVAPAVDPVTNTTLVRVRIRNKDHLLKVGMYAEAHVQLEEHPHALVVPASALVRDGDGPAVYVVKDAVATRTAVTTGLEQDGLIEVLSGVTEGQAILTSAVHGLGESVRLAAPQ